jgi:Flp pilus assembly protein TadD
MFSHVKFLSFFCVFAFLPCTSLIAQSTDAKSPAKLEPGFTILADLTGSPLLIEKEGDTPRPLQKGEKIPANATILTGTDGRVDLAMSNGALIQVLDHSKLIIGEFLQDPCNFVVTEGTFFLTQEAEIDPQKTPPHSTTDPTTEGWNKLSIEPTISKCQLLLSEGTIVGSSKKPRSGSKLEIVTPIGTADIMEVVTPHGAPENRGSTWRTTITPTEKPHEFRGVIQITNGSIFFTKPDGTGSVSIASDYSLQFSARVSPPRNVVFYALSATPMSRESIQTLLSMVSEVESKQIYFKLGHGPAESLLASTNEAPAPELKEAKSDSPEPKTDQASESPPPATKSINEEKIADKDAPKPEPEPTSDSAVEPNPVAEQTPTPQETAALAASPLPTSDQASEPSSPASPPINEEKIADKDAPEPSPEPTSDSAVEPNSVAEQTPTPEELATPAPKPEPTSLTEDLNALSPQAREIADLGTKLYNDKRFFDAVIIFRRALKVAPDNLFVIAHVAIAKIQVGKISDARMGLEKVLLKKPNDLLVLTNLAIVYARLKAFDKAIATLNHILEIDPQNAIAHHDMGVALGKTVKLKESEDYLFRSIALDPNFAKAHLTLASLYLQQSPPAIDLARASYEKAKSLGAPTDSKIDSQLKSP